MTLNIRCLLIGLLIVSSSFAQDLAQRQSATVSFSHDQDGRLGMVHIFGTGISRYTAMSFEQKSDDVDEVHIDAVNATLSNDDVKLLTKLQHVTSFEVADGFRPNKLIDQNGIAHIVKFKELETLVFPVANVEGISQLSPLEKLEHLDLSCSGITNSQVKQLCELKHLKNLNLSFTNISDECLGDLEKLDGLNRLTLRQTKLSESAIQELRKTLKTTHIESHQQTESSKTTSPATRFDKDDERAIRAAWNKIAGPDTQHDGEPSAIEFAWFTGFLESRLRIAPPDWWSKIMLSGKMNSNDQTWFSRGDKWPYKGFAPRVHKGIKRITLSDGQQALGIGDQTISIGKLTKQTAPSVSDIVVCATTNSDAFLAFPDDFARPFTLLKKDIKNNECSWSTTVIVNDQIGSITGRSWHFVEITVDENEEAVFVFGAAPNRIYVKKFAADTGKRLFSFDSYRR